MKKIILFSLALVFVFSGIAMAVEQVADGAKLLEDRCSVCHSSERPKSKQKTPEQWESTVSRMIGKGAKLSAEEKAVLVKYLSETHKP